MPIWMRRPEEEQEVSTLDRHPIVTRVLDFGAGAMGSAEELAAVLCPLSWRAGGGRV